LFWLRTSKDAPLQGAHFAVFRIENVNRLCISPGQGGIVPPFRLSAPEEIIPPGALGEGEDEDGCEGEGEVFGAYRNQVVVK